MRTTFASGSVRAAPRSVVVEVGLLEHNQVQILIGGDHNLLLVLASDSEERQVILGVNVADDGAGLLSELSDFLRNLDGVLVLLEFVHGGSEDFAVLVNDQETNDTAVLFNSQNALFNFCHNKIN